MGGWITWVDEYHGLMPLSIQIIRISGVSSSVDEITERDISRGTLEPLQDSESVSELIIADSLHLWEALVRDMKEK